MNSRVSLQPGALLGHTMGGMQPRTALQPRREGFKFMLILTLPYSDLSRLPHQM